MSKPVVSRYNGFKDRHLRLGFECPGCGQLHAIPVEGPKAWGFNGNLERPTFTPSLLVRWEQGPERTQHVCHLYVREGQIEFLGDCTHALAGKTVPLTPVE